MFALPPEWAFALESKRFSGSPTQFHIHRLTGGDARISTCLPQRAITVDLVAETTRAFFVPCAQIGLYVCVAPGEFGKQTDPLMPMSAVVRLRSHYSLGRESPA
jgi:hypothetical protein